jgi:pimeloyl-ACP methyl ester carboxylesterase
MLAPGVDDTGRGYKNRFGEVLDKNLLLMNRRIAAGKGDEPVGNIDFWFCPRAQVSANSFISYYGEQSKFRQFLTTMPKIDIPTLVITGTVDEVVPEVEKVVMPMVDNKRIFLTTIEGAGHFFRDFNIEEAMEAAVEFLDKTR